MPLGVVGPSSYGVGVNGFSFTTSSSGSTFVTVSTAVAADGAITGSQEGAILVTACGAVADSQGWDYRPLRKYGGGFLRRFRRCVETRPRASVVIVLFPD